MNLAIIALVVNLIVMVIVSALTRGSAAERTGRFERVPTQDRAMVEG